MQDKGLSVVALLCGVIMSSAQASEPVRLLALGDMPYRGAEQDVQFAQLLADAGAAQADLIIHVGDTKSGTAPCTDAFLERMRDQLDAVDGALLYTPGDNEWTDCSRTAAGGYNPMERLDVLRGLYFAEPTTLGQKPLPVQRQADLMPDHAAYVENARLALGDVVVMTLHVVGSNNNLLPKGDLMAEYRDRMDANLAWLDNTVAQADALVASGHARALVIAMQADPKFEEDDEDERSGFSRIIEAFEDAAAVFGRPILIIHGDSHRFVIDHPYFAYGEATDLNLMRLEVYGDLDLHAVEVTVDTSARQPFAFRPATLRSDR